MLNIYNAHPLVSDPCGIWRMYCAEENFGFLVCSKRLETLSVFEKLRRKFIWDLGRLLKKGIRQCPPLLILRSIFWLRVRDSLFLRAVLQGSIFVRKTNSPGGGVSSCRVH